jgi:predicted O-methyltransferase YrrM
MSEIPMMRDHIRIVLLFLLLISPAEVAWAQHVPPHVDAILKQIKAADKDLLAVSEEDGRFMRLLVATSGAKRALEIGAASGYSAIWIGLGMRETGGKLVTIEYDKARAQQAAANIKKAGLSDVVQVISGDAFAEIPKLPGTFDFVFCDAWKRDYQKFFTMVFPRMDKGGLFLGHNVINKRDEMPDFLKTIHTSPAVISSIVSPSGEGMSITYKR